MIRCGNASAVTGSSLIWAAWRAALVGWPRLASLITRCRVFLAVYCDDYFRSDFCQWELQLAVVRDPTGARGIIVPVALDEAPLPDYCKLVRAQSAAQPGFPEDLLRVLRQVLS